MSHVRRALCGLAILLLPILAFRVTAADPYREGTFRGRIAWSADGNHNDRDDWIASPVALAIFAEAGLKDRVIHFDYNCILPQTDPEWERIHAASVLGAAERYGYETNLFFDCRRDLEGTLTQLVAAINASSEDDPLWFVVAGPMEVPFLAIQRSAPEKREFVHCISHSAWNDGFATTYSFTHTKREVIESGVHWVQIQDQNRLLAQSRYGAPAKPEEFVQYFWMRDSQDPKVRFLWERMLVSTRPDPSDAGMAWFLVTGDEEATPAKLRHLLAERVRPDIVDTRSRVRLEAENFVKLAGFAVEFANDRKASQRLSVKGDAGGSIATPFHEPYAADAGTYDVEVRYQAGPGARLGLRVGEDRQGGEWAGQSPQEWTSQTLRAVPMKQGDEIAVEVQGKGPVKLDFVQFTRRN